MTINSLEDAEAAISRSALAIEISGIKENGFEIMYDLYRRRNAFLATEGGAALDDFIPGEMADIFEDLAGDAIGTKFGKDVVDAAAYIEVLATYGPDDPTSDWTNPLGYLSDRVSAPIKQELFEQWQGYLDADAAEVYRNTGDIGPLQERTVKRYIREYNIAYGDALELHNSGELVERYPKMAANFRLGFQTDLFARSAMIDWFQDLGINTATDPNVGINQRVYDPLDEGVYRIPDLRIGDSVLEGTLWQKTLDTPQLADIVDWTDPRSVVVVTPYDHNRGQVRRYSNR